MARAARAGSRRGRDARRASRWRSTCSAMLDFRGSASRLRLRQQHPPGGAYDAGVKDAFDFPGLRARLHPPAVLRRHRPVPLGGAVGRSRGHLPHRPQGEGAIPDERAPASLARHGEGAHPVPGPAGAHLLGRPRPASSRSASPSTRWWRSGELKAPIVIGRDHLDSGSVASPNRETEAMKDGSDAVADWPLLNALLNTASGATWVSHPPRRRRRHRAIRSTPAW